MYRSLMFSLLHKYWATFGNLLRPYYSQALFGNNSLQPGHDASVQFMVGIHRIENYTGCCQKYVDYTRVFFFGLF